MNILTGKFCQILRFTYNVIIIITQIMTRRLATCHVSIASCFSKTEHAVYSSETMSLRQPIYTVLIGNRITVVFSFRASDNISRTKSRLFYFRECSSTAFGTCCWFRNIDVVWNARVTPRWLRRWLNNEKVICSLDPVDLADDFFLFYRQFDISLMRPCSEGFIWMV